MNAIFQYLRKVGGLFLLLLLLYFLAAFIGSLILINKNQGNDNLEIEVYLISNGVHTDIAVPTHTVIFNWTKLVDPQFTLSQKETNYLSFGWGDLDFYRTTPEWKDLTLKTAANSLFLKTPSALHVTFRDRMQDSENTVLVRLNKEQYQKLVSYIKGSFEYDTTGNTQPITNLHYNNYDVFYRAKGSLNLFNTCNTWANNGLKHSGVKACLWTPFSDGVLYPYH